MVSQLDSFLSLVSVQIEAGVGFGGPGCRREDSNARGIVRPVWTKRGYGGSL